jgi:ATP-dependent exoDNAse (exonuclease V) alpha subunit
VSAAHSEQSWLPILQRIVNITLSKTVKCKRRQLPVVPACAITIHKSQGGTFDEIVKKYSATQPQQSVYVALSRVTAVTVLHIITHKDVTFRFVHGRRGSNEPATLRDTRRI